jgi:hypothetical protein
MSYKIARKPEKAREIMVRVPAQKKNPPGVIYFRAKLTR